ncbi:MULTISPECIES: helicase-related protein [unclassified Nocardioides]|uniref:helicase-related protein n=1 Tax=unclassified Nocardioides TaxID=2615069 RepID=UPI000B33188F|nr:MULTISPECIES: helicase-related protein [unclassified Nocardioides]
MSQPADWLIPGILVNGLDDGPVEIVEVSHVGAGAFIKVRDDLGRSRTQMLDADQLAALTPVTAGAPTLDADIDEFRLAIEAIRLTHAHSLNPLLAVSSSNVEPLPHQVQAVYDHLLKSHPQRFLLADDPGAGKTVMAGLFLKEAMSRGWVKRCLIVVPGSLAEQWQDELSEKFGLRFEVFESSLVPDHGVEDPLRAYPFLIIRLDQFSRNQKLMDLIDASTYDLAIVDEAHKLTARTWGSKVVKSKRFEFGELLRNRCPSLLLMTATPHNGKEADFQEFMSLLRNAGTEAFVADATEAGLMRRLVKEQLVHLDGRPLFPERRAKTVAYRLSPLEVDLYEDVSEYVREEMNKVSADDAKRTVGFALLVLQRRLASSPEAILRSLSRRHDRLQSEANRVRAADSQLSTMLAASLGLQRADVDDLSPADAESYEDEGAAVATAARTIEELEVEIAILERLVTKATAVRAAQVDAKWEALAGLLLSDQMYDEDGARRKIIIFTEHRDTLDYLEGRLFDLLPRGTEIQVIHGAVSRADRRIAQIRFTSEASSSILLATDAAGEGVNLQVAHLMVNYDIPWNPNRLEQRFGRIHRIGQRHICHLWSLVAVDTREGDVLQTLFEKLEVQRQALGDQVFDVLGQVLTDSSLSTLLERALDGANQAEIAQALDRVSDDLASAVKERAAAVSTLTEEELAVLRQEMELARAASFQPDVVKDFTLTALARFRGDIAQAGSTWQVRHVPQNVRGTADSGVLPRYDRLIFGRGDDAASFVTPEMMSPGHPLLAALVAAVDTSFGDRLRQGVLLEDDRTDQNYTLLTVLAPATSNRPGELITRKINDTGEIEDANPALFTDLSPATRASRDDDIAAVSQSIEEVTLGEGLVAVARVLGTADADVAQSWRNARASLRTKMTGRTVVPAIDGQGWDFMVADDQVHFHAAVPTGVTLPRRRSESQAANNVPDAYVVHVVE